MRGKAWSALFGVALACGGGNGCDTTNDGGASGTGSADAGTTSAGETAAATTSSSSSGAGGTAALGGTTSSPGGTAGSGGVAGCPGGVSQPLEVATFNVRFDDGTNESDVNAWNNSAAPRREKVIALVMEMAPDILGVQEALVNQVADLREALDGYGFVGVGRLDGAEAGEFCGIFYRLERLELLDEGHFWLSETPEVIGTVFAGSGSVRNATWVVLRDLSAQRELFLLNTHFDNVSQSSRELSAELVRERLGTLPDGRPVIMTGDLNEVESNAAIRTLLAEEPTSSPALIDGYRQVFPSVAPDEATFHDFGGNTQGSRIDYVLHDSSFETIDAAIWTDDFDGTYPSDHFPVTGTLSWRPTGDCAP